MKSPINRFDGGIPKVPMAVICLCACVLLGIGTAVSPPSSLTGDASWIWHPDALNLPDCRVYFAKEVALPPNAVSVTFLCTADNEYTLFVNGQRAGASPGPGDLGRWWQRLDEHNLNQFVCPGSNYLSVEACNVTDAAGFIGILEIVDADGVRRFVVTNESWVVSLEQPKDWPHGELRGRAAVNLGKPPVQPWGKLSPPTELSRAAADLQVELSRTLILPERILEVQSPPDSIEESNNLLIFDGRTARVDLPAGEELSLVLDFGQEVVGYPRARMLGRGASLRLAYGESLSESLHAKPIQLDKCTVSQDEWLWLGHDRRAFRYLKITISDSPAPLEIDYIGLDLVHYPVEYRGSFRCSDEMLNRIWEVGQYTTKLCMQDFFEDGIKRDRILWVGDFRIEALSAYYAFGDYRLAKRDLIRLADIQLPDGAVPAFGPAASSLILPDYCAYWVSALYEYYMHSGDKDAVRLLWPNVERQMEWFARQVNRDSLIRDADRRDWWCFIDWGDIEKKGEVAALQAVYHEALLAAANLAEVVGARTSEKEYQVRASRLRKSARGRLWCEHTGAYADCRTRWYLSSRASRQTNALAVVTGLADAEDWNSIYEHAFSRDAAPATTPYMNFYVVNSLYRMRHDRHALDLIRDYWGGMILRGATTYWESYDPAKPADFVPDSVMSFCHGWSGGVTSILPAEVAGVKPLAPGFAKVAVVPNLSDLKWAEAVVPTPQGDVRVGWKQNSSQISGDFVFPERCEAVIGLPVEGRTSRISINGEAAWDAGRFTGAIGIRSAWADDRYVYFDLARGGKYSVRATTID